MPGVDAPSAGRQAPQIERDQVPNWNRTNIQRQAIRTRFWMSQHPRFVTNILIAINVLVYLVTVFLSATRGAGVQGLGEVDPNVLVNMGGQVGVLVAQGQVWRV